MLTSIRNAYTHRELLWNLTQRELRVRYRRSVLGWGWALVNPAATTLVYAYVFAVVFKIKIPPGHPSGMNQFVFFLLAGVLPWNHLSTCLTSGIGSVLGAGSLISRVYLPRELIPAATVLALTVSLLIELGVLMVIILCFGFVALQMIPVILLLVVLQTIFVLGLALWLSALNVRYRDVQHLMAVLLLIWFYLTPVLYSTTLIPEHKTLLGHSVPLRSIMLFNPMARFVMAYRNCFYDIRLPGLPTLLGCVVASVASLWFGTWYFNRRSPRFAEEL